MNQNKKSWGGQREKKKRLSKNVSTNSKETKINYIFLPFFKLIGKNKL